MYSLGSHPILSLQFNTTIAASADGTAAATVLNSSFSATNAKSMQIFNATLRDIEFVFQSADPGTGAMVGCLFVPGNFTSPGVVATNGQLLPINMQQGGKILARTTTNVPITASEVLQLRINFWA